jgi:hypothetical protein
MSEEMTIDCPALHSRSKLYPERFEGRVPKTIRMLRTVQPDQPMRSLSPEWRGVIAEHGMIYGAYTNSHGAVCAVLDDGKKLGVKPDEFEVVTWHDSTNAQ